MTTDMHDVPLVPDARAHSVRVIAVVADQAPLTHVLAGTHVIVRIVDVPTLRAARHRLSALRAAVRIAGLTRHGRTVWAVREYVIRHYRAAGSGS
jgi:hypothetical protein